jgi:pimeloyl-ACP methyl ester carboxylesterase
VIGDGERDLVFLPGWPSHLALMWENPAFAAFLQGLASFSRLILFDRLGGGMSDRGPTGRAFEDGMDDVRAVLASVGSQHAALFGWSLGGRLALLFAATHPEQTTAVITFGSHPATLRDDDYPWGATAEEREQLLSTRPLRHPRPRELLAGLSPSDAGDAAAGRWWSTYWHSAITPPESVDEILAHGPVDIRELLGSVRVPTLVLHRTGDRAVKVEASRYIPPLGAGTQRPPAIRAKRCGPPWSGSRPRPAPAPRPTGLSTGHSGQGHRGLRCEIGRSTDGRRPTVSL